MGIEYYVGIDIGSTCAKTVVMGAEEKILYRLLRPTGWSSVETASSIREELESLGISADRSIVVSTGYGRAAVPFAAKNITEITCHARGACHIHGTEDLTVIDIGWRTHCLSLRSNCANLPGQEAELPSVPCVLSLPNLK